MEGQLKLLPPIRQDGDIPRKLYAVPNKQTIPGEFDEHVLAHHFQYFPSQLIPSTIQQFRFFINSNTFTDSIKKL